jgi:hypothetical protein
MRTRPHLWLLLLAIHGGACTSAPANSPRAAREPDPRFIEAGCPGSHEIRVESPVTTSAVRGVFNLGVSQDRLEPVADATIRVWDLSGHRIFCNVQGDQDGRFACPAIPPGAYRLVACKRGFDAREVPITISSEAPVVPLTIMTYLST